jgi:hypothetical protein
MSTGAAYRPGDGHVVRKRSLACRRDVTELIALLKVSLLGDEPPATPPTAADIDSVVKAVLACDVLYHMVSNLSKLHFETRKDVVAIFSFVCKHRPSSQDGASTPNGSGSGAGPSGMPSRNGAVSASSADLGALGSKAPMKTPGLDYVRENPGILERLCACVPAPASAPSSSASTTQSPRHASSAIRVPFTPQAHVAGALHASGDMCAKLMQCQRFHHHSHGAL